MMVDRPEMEPPVDELETPDDEQGRAEIDDPAHAKKSDALRAWVHAGLAAWQPILVTALVVGALALAGGMYIFRYGPDRQISDSAIQQVVRAASDGTVALLSYSPSTLDHDFADAKSHLTGDLLAWYTKFTDQTVGPTAKDQQITASAKVIRAAVSEQHRASAVVLVFVNQSTVSREKPEPTVTDSSFLATMANINGSWLIAKFDRL